HGSRIVLLTASSSRIEMAKATRTYAGTGLLPWLPLVVPSLVDEARVLDFGSLLSAFRAARQAVHDVRPDAIFLLPNSGETLKSRLKKMLFFAFAGFRGPFYGVRLRNSLGFMCREQHAAGLYEHEVFGATRAVEECALEGGRAEHAIRFPLSTAGADAWVS